MLNLDTVLVLSYYPITDITRTSRCSDLSFFAGSSSVAWKAWVSRGLEQDSRSNQNHAVQGPQGYKLVWATVAGWLRIACFQQRRAPVLAFAPLRYLVPSGVFLFSIRPDIFNHILKYIYIFILIKKCTIAYRPRTTFPQFHVPIVLRLVNQSILAFIQ